MSGCSRPAHRSATSRRWKTPPNSPVQRDSVAELVSRLTGACVAIARAGQPMRRAGHPIAAAGQLITENLLSRGLAGGTVFSCSADEFLYTSFLNQRSLINEVRRDCVACRGKVVDYGPFFFRQPVGNIVV